MFKYYDDLENLLKCLNCKEKYNLPKTLPCGQAICESCETSLTSKSSKSPLMNNGQIIQLKSNLKCPSCLEDLTTLQCGTEVCNECEISFCISRYVTIKCPFCLEQHQKPQNGFPIDATITRLLNMKSVEFYRGDAHKYAKTAIQNLGSVIEELNENIDNSRVKLNNYCDFIRNSIDTSTESRIAALDAFRQAFISEINQYEHDCMVNISETNESFKEFYSYLNENNDERERWSVWLDQPDLTDDAINEMKSSAENVLNSVKCKIADLDVYLFSNKKIQFIPSEVELVSDNLGKLLQSPIKEPEPTSA